MDAPAKQQIVERVKQANNILVTVSNDPTVDQLAALIGLTLLLNKMDKSATAVFSGKVPSTIEFLQPSKTIETNTDSLRDFIISLDKSKADKLRYKVEDQVVRIFITPYRTALSEKDLVFSEGDFNVEVVIALGIKERSQIDAAITSHGRILHDATIISVNTNGGKAAEIGQINWQEPTASSLSEMLVSISEAFGSGLIDNQIATAFLTGIVAETKRFSNDKTSPKTMTMSAQLMASGANQQLIVSKLEPPPPPPPPPLPPKPPTKPRQPSAPPHKQPPKPEPKKKDDGTLNISHEPARPNSLEVHIDPNEIHIDEQGILKTQAELKIESEKAKAPPPPPPPPPLPPVSTQLPPLSFEETPFKPPQPSTPPPPLPDAGPAKPIHDGNIPEPHDALTPMDRQSTMNTPFTANTQPEWQDPSNTKSVDPLTGNTGDDAILGHSPLVAPPAASSSAPIPPGPNPTVDSARNAVEGAYEAAPFDPAMADPVEALNAQPVGPELHMPTPAPPAPSGTANYTLPVGNGPATPPPLPPPIPFMPPAPPRPN